MTVQKINDRITPSLKKISKSLDKLAAEAYDHWVSITPKKSGNARRNTRLRGDTISAEYPYAQPLDSGRSDQAPDGMSKPTERFVERRTKQIIRK